MCDRCTIDRVKAAMQAEAAPSCGPRQSALCDATARVNPTTFSSVVDLTHRLTPDFPTFFGPAFELESIRIQGRDGFTLNRLNYPEHVGTHFDAPLHFSADGSGIDEIPISQLVCPLVVIDVREKVAQDEDYRLSLADLELFETRYGRIPDSACVAMFSGWETRLGSELFCNIDTHGIYHFPGFHEEVASFLIENRQVHGLAVDTMSLDFGATIDSAVHNIWLPSGRYGIENVANLGLTPPLGATLVAGAPKIQGTTGGPGRLIALF